MDTIWNALLFEFTQPMAHFSASTEVIAEPNRFAPSRVQKPNLEDVFLELCLQVRRDSD